MIVENAALLTGQDVEVDEVARSECEGPQCAGGSGIRASFAGVISLTRFRVARAALCGLHVAPYGVLTVFSGEVVENEIGACVEEAGYDVRRLRDQVRFRDNARNVEATTLPVPDGVAPPDLVGGG